MSKYFLFPDLETTGVDPRTDAILEAAWLITDENFEVVSEPRSYPIALADDQVPRLALMSDFVRNMHTESGLLDDLNDSEKTASLDRIYVEMYEDIDRVRLNADDTFHLAGMSVHFDKDFLMANEFDNLFRNFGSRSPVIHHRQLDLSSLKMMLGAAGLSNLITPVENPHAHRAIWDVHEGLLYARLFRSALQGAFPFAPVPVSETDDEIPVPSIEVTTYEPLP